jgi:ribosomal protein S18 acetylase RimI-like enzyme
MLAPEHCFVLDDGTGKAVGYIIGTHDTAEFVRQVREVFVPYLLVEGLHPPDPGEEVGWNENLPNALRFIMHSPENLLHLEEPELLRDFPAHLHIDILPGHQRLGFGRKLIDMFTTALKDQGVKGVHLIMSEANVEAAKFYLHTGWKRFPKVLDGGKSGEEGVKEYAAWMVKSL